ncbi:MAG: type II toxin-antitoxin system HigB family toxin [Spirochaetes bacterium]|nr:type II toxin-antitoxin system HigB family toxin [Spirochaetota bacterium]
MNVVALRTLVRFWGKHPRAKQALEDWYHEALHARWVTPEDVKRHYPGASILRNNRVQFDIRGNEFRLVCAIRYDKGHMWVKFIGTHAEYDRIDAETYDGNPV